MTYVDGGVVTPSFKEFAILKLSSLAQNRARKVKKESTRVTAVLNAIVRFVLHVAGFGLLTMAGFQFNIIAGLVVAGISCFALSTLMTRSDGGGQDVSERRAQDLRTGR